MSASWRREDYGYAAAAAVALSFLLYLIVGNFGLVPSPVAQAAAASERFSIASLAFPAQPAPPVVAPLPPVPGARPVRVQPLPRRVSSGDTTAPGAQITTDPGTTFAVTEPAVVQGTASDAGSGIAGVLVGFESSDGTVRNVRATVDCAGQASCSWEADVPAEVGTFTVSALAEDRAGNEGRSNDVEVTVVNSGRTLEPVTEVIPRVPTLLNKLVSQVVGLLGG